jgi:soluble lytic murein transglycosylase
VLDKRQLELMRATDLASRRNPGKRRTLVLAAACALCIAIFGGRILFAQNATTSQETKKHSTTPKKTTGTSHSAHPKTATHPGTHTHKKHAPLSAKALAKSHSLQRAFVASSQLRPMAQQLTTMRTPAAYAGVTAFAQLHTGEAASAAYLALGHAYLTDKKFP